METVFQKSVSWKPLYQKYKTSKKVNTRFLAFQWDLSRLFVSESENFFSASTKFWAQYQRFIFGPVFLFYLFKVGRIYGKIKPACNFFHLLCRVPKEAGIRYAPDSCEHVFSLLNRIFITNIIDSTWRQSYERNLVMKMTKLGLNSLTIHNFNLD